MPHYFIDTYDGERLLRDEEGSELPGAPEACDEAFRLLPEIAREATPGCSRQDLTAVVRDGRGRRIARVTLSLKAEWLAHARSPDAAAQGGPRRGGEDGTALAGSPGERSAPLGRPRAGHPFPMKRRDPGTLPGVRTLAARR